MGVQIGPNRIRQMVFFPFGEICFGWKNRIAVRRHLNFRDVGNDWRLNICGRVASHIYKASHVGNE